MSTLASVTIYDVYANLPTFGIPGRLFFVSTGTNAGNGYYDTGSAWELIVQPGGSSPLTTKGDLFGYSTTNARVAVGADGKVLTADSTNADGVSWQTPSGGGGTPSYLGPGGYADRSGVILMTGTQGFNGSLNAWLIPNQNVGYFSGGSVSGYIQFNFQVQLLITEATFNQQNADAQGTWQWQGSNDGTTFTNIGATFSLGGATSQVLTTLNGNTTRYQYLRLNGISGSTSAGPYIYAMLFKSSF